MVGALRIRVAGTWARGFQHWANHLADAALIEAGAQQIGEGNPTVEDMESEDYEANQGSVRPKALI